MSLADELANGETFGGWRFHHSKAGVRRAGFRGSAAFFALLLAAASSSSPADENADAGLRASEARQPDGTSAALHRATALPPQIAASSKFSRRRMPLSVPTLEHDRFRLLNLKR
jgi:hypothetical protein